MKKNLFLVIMSICSIMAYSQSKMSNYTRSYLLGADNVRREVQGDREVSTISAFVHFYEAIDLTLLEQYGVVVESEFETLNLVTATIPVDKLVLLAEEDAIRYIEMATPLYPQLDVAHNETGVNLVHAGTDQSTRPYLGSNVIVGIVDYGFQYSHPAFYNSDASASRIVRVWEQETSNGLKPAKFSYGREYTNIAELLNRKFEEINTNKFHHQSNVFSIQKESMSSFISHFLSVITLVLMILFND